MKALAIIGCLALAGCGGETKQVNVQISGDSYCTIARKITWSTNDTRPTIDQVRRENAKVDKICGKATS